MWTKDMEREQLRKIEDLINATEDGSYIRMAFAGCVNLARENIEYDFGNSYPDMIEVKDKEILSMRERINDLLKKLEKADKVGKDAQERIKEITENIDTMDKSYHAALELIKTERAEKEELQKEMDERCAEQAQEIIRLKAEIYDLERSADNGTV